MDQHLDAAPISAALQGAGRRRAGAPHLVAVEPQAAQAVEDLRLQEAHPAGVQLHDHAEGGVGRQDDVIDHAGVVADPDVIGPVHGAGPVVADDACPAGHKYLALETHQAALELHALLGVLLRGIRSACCTNIVKKVVPYVLLVQGALLG